ncbi:Stp1/IreP family PP2C-type Ser/Thr phosphatase [Staphylococcus auricularis]|uniref:Stp1/IreP family PP2C-type Ser/Thr phosphatase n=1 Tax=Staphylococcus auricularis TaxID=29379 RepID=A0ABX5IGI5_9STAP|nr:Stp1/IreP family PP2C-type Ser/Thr phosphatase [Staphylococcus auricularis]MEB6569617.1 Stp1/IreP family PP2C-type Ser/Thr phosphatase [Staphylococcus auricularis]PTH18607.1 Stp1/IreP family PP2C-type Ser/Thr phosphatase [Staphylococcus auricularis]PTH27616.1 Stp1/IreP family PP2C-type Ser/Thr phosphatase [Staphylococcus auricularis]
MLNAQFFTNTGQFRDKNEDAGGIYYNQTQQQLLVICDGMGGHRAGEVASQFVVDAIKTRFEAENYIEESQAEDWLQTTLGQVNRELYQQSVESTEYHGMGTTCVCALVYDHHVVIANIGDSRAYLINSRKIEQVTHDHSFVNYLLMIGEISEEEAFNHPQRNIITKVMGTDKFVKADIFVKRTRLYNYLLFATDGLTDYVRDDTLQQLLSDEKEDLHTQGEKLLEHAEAASSKDNISIILAEIEGEQV